ncbi:hypothetical protein F4780DRAFT_784019 [Xylariomycetidae sp. FL0641]|nr:hypothetical protein F4780DRAFT_784019 [Xylariomycetidae sp. FL0641]
MYRLDKARNKAAARLKSTFESIFEKYEKDFTDVGDEINLHTGEVTVNNGHLQSIDKNEQGERGDSPESDEEERILAGKRPPSAAGRTRPPHSPHSSPTPLSFRASLFGNNPIDPAWQTPELPMNNPYNGFGFGGQSMGAFPFSNFGHMPDGEQRSDSHGRRSARSRKKTEFYGNISWLKRGAKPIKTDVGDPTSASNSNSVATTVSDSHRDPDRDLESTMVKGAKEVPLQASGTVQLDSSLGITDQASFKDHTIPKPNGTNTAEMEISQSLPAELVQQPYVSAKAMEVKKDQASVVEKFSRNVLDPSYEFSDEEGDVLPMPIPFEDFMRSSPVQEKELHVSDMTTGLSSAVPDEDGQTASGVLESPRSQEADDAISYQPKADDETRQHGIDQSENNLTTSDVVSQEDPEQIAARLVDKLLQGAIEVENEPLNQEIQDPVDDSIIPSDQPDLPPQSDLAPTQEESVQLQAEVTAAEEEPEIFLRPVSCINRNTPGRTEESPAPSIPTPRTPLTPQKKTTGSSKKPTSTRRPSASSSKKFALATLLPDDETDELSFFSPAAAAAPTPPPFRSPRAQSRALSLAASASATTAATPLASASHHRRRSLLAGTPSSSARRRPQTDLRRLPKRKSAGAGAVVNSSPLARTAARNLLATPKKRKRFADEMEAELVRTPGGTMRKCGVDGFVCDRDFCFTCCR